MNVIEIVNALSLEHGGPTYSISRLAQCLARFKDLNVELHALSDNTLPPDFPVPVHVYVQARDRSKWPGAWKLKRELSRLALTSEIFHSHGLWRIPNFLSAWATERGSCRHVISPRGMLSMAALNTKAFKKKIALFLGQKKALESAAVLHATSQMEYDDIRRFGLKAPVAIVPNGVDLPSSGKQLSKDPNRILLFMGRLDPIKRIDQLLKAWSQLEAERTDWELHLTGPGPIEYEKELKALSRSLKLTRAFFNGPIYGGERDERYRKAEILVLPSYSENFGIVVAEALSHGTPVIASTGTPWKELPQRKAGWWVDGDADSLLKALRTSTSLDRQELFEMGSAGRAWIGKEFGWDRAGEMMRETYRWCLGEVSKPDWIIT